MKKFVFYIMVATGTMIATKVFGAWIAFAIAAVFLVAHLVRKVESNPHNTNGLPFDR